MENHSSDKLFEVVNRIRLMRLDAGYTVEEMAEKTDVSVDQYLAYEEGNTDLPFTFIHKCSLAFGLELSDILEGQSANLTSYTITRKGKGQVTASEDGIEIKNLAPRFKKKLGEPYFVKYEYSADQQDKPIHTTTHSGQEFDMVIKGTLKVQIGDNTEILSCLHG